MICQKVPFFKKNKRGSGFFEKREFPDLLNLFLTFEMVYIQNVDNIHKLFSQISSNDNLCLIHILIKRLFA